MDNPAQNLLGQLNALTERVAEFERLKAVVDGLRFHLVTVPRAGAPTAHDFDTLELVAGHVRGLVGQDVQVFLFHGHRLAVTRGPHRYVVGTNGARVPLFEVDAEDVDPDGWLTDHGCEHLPSAAPDPPPLTVPAAVSN